MFWLELEASIQRNHSGIWNSLMPLRSWENGKIKQCYTRQFVFPLMAVERRVSAEWWRLKSYFKGLTMVWGWKLNTTNIVYLGKAGWKNKRDEGRVIIAWKDSWIEVKIRTFRYDNICELKRQGLGGSVPSEGVVFAGGNVLVEIEKKRTKTLVNSYPLGRYFILYDIKIKENKLKVHEWEVI